MADSVLEFVNSAIESQLDNLDISDKIDNAIDESDLESKIESAVSDFDFSSVIDEDLVRSNIDLDSLFGDWIESKFNKEIQPDIEAIREDGIAIERNIDAQAKLIAELTFRILALESAQNNAKRFSLSKALSKVWARIRGLFVRMEG
jgi:SMC interacting uncharacterized protein involved in chromosome segregation